MRISDWSSDVCSSDLSRNEPAFVFSSLEQLLELSPDDHSKRFDLAYAYAEAEMNDMALFHYHSVPPEARDYGTWNNLGVAYENQKLTIKAIYSYTESKKLGNTLAMSNLAYRFFQAGFLDEAKSVWEAAAKVHNKHQKVDPEFANTKD